MSEREIHISFIARHPPRGAERRRPRLQAGRLRAEAEPDFLAVSRPEDYIAGESKLPWSLALPFILGMAVLLWFGLGAAIAHMI